MNEKTTENQMQEKNRATRGVIRWLIREVMGAIILALLLFISAGRWDWGMGWALVVITLLWTVGTALAVIPRNPGMLAERTGMKKGAKNWDAAIIGVIGVLNLARCVIAGLDLRNGWTINFPFSLQVAMLLVVVLGYGILVWAMGSNAFFSLQVRIQKERDHNVATGGPYRYVRHPGYVGQILFELGAPLMLGSWWALIPALGIAFLAIIRTRLEDKTLQQELEGYRAYSQQVKYRLLPGVW